MTEYVYFVDKTDTPTGETSEKYAAHHSDTQMHAAFSCYIFNQKGQILATQRAASKKVWPTVWTNSCCGHPAPGESREDALRRRVQYELGMKVKGVQLVLPKYAYKTPPYNGIVEHEFCPVFVALADSAVMPNPDEVGDYLWMDWSEYVDALDSDTSDYSNPHAADAPKWSWWCKDQLSQLKDTAAFKTFLKETISS